MNKKEVIDKLWSEFQKFMVGQTVSVDKEGNVDFYEWDVDRFILGGR